MPPVCHSFCRPLFFPHLPVFSFPIKFLNYAVKPGSPPVVGRPIIISYQERIRHFTNRLQMADFALCQVGLFTELFVFDCKIRLAKAGVRHLLATKL